MRPDASLLLLLAALALAAAAPADPPSRTAPDSTDAPEPNDTLSEPISNYTLLVTDDAGNNTIVDPHEDGDEHEPIVRKKRTFGDIVFRGLADVLGYSVAKKAPQVAFPPPLPPVPGIDTPIQAAIDPVAVAAPAPAPAPAALLPCGAPRAAVPPPCRPQQTPPPAKPKAASPPCPKPRAAPRPKLTPPPPPPLCVKPRAANPATPAPCAPAPAPPAPPKADSNLETIMSNLQFQFNFNRNQVTPAPDTAAETIEEQQAAPAPLIPVAPIAIAPRAAKLPPAQPARNPRVFVDAFVLRNGVTQRVDTIDAQLFNVNQASAEDDFLAYDDEEDAPAAPLQPAYDDYEDVQESQDRAKAVAEFGTAVDRFWEEKKRHPKKKKKLPANHYQNVHFGDRDLVNQVQRRSDRESHQSLQRNRARQYRDPVPPPLDTDEDAESTTTTEDPRRPLRPRVLPPTEQNPGHIDTVTVRVPPIYREKRPKKLHREQPDRDEDDDDDRRESSEHIDEDEDDAEGENSAPAPQTEAPARRRRRKKLKRKTRATHESETYTAGDYDYYGNKLPISAEEEFYRQLTVPPPTKDADLARHEEVAVDDGLDESERIREDPNRSAESERIKDDPDRTNESERSDESERSNERERTRVGGKRTDEAERAHEAERSDRLSPNARVHETGYRNNYVHATNVLVDDPHPSVSTLTNHNTRARTTASPGKA